MIFSSKLPHVGTTIFSTMSKMAGDYNAINLSQGFPNFPTDEILIELIKQKLHYFLVKIWPLKLL